MAAKVLKEGMEVLRPLLAETGAPKVGTMVIGTVKGDIHDIGKNLVGMMMKGAGFEVIDIGINNSVEEHFEAIKEHNPDILGMSALLTTTMPYMRVVINALKEEGIRDQITVLVGGPELAKLSPSARYGKAIGVLRGKSLILNKHKVSKRSISFFYSLNHIIL
jgi:methylmalonyl-CoA mutase cobalamin-binding domain/chain